MQGERYEGGRDLADLVKFVNEKAGTQRTNEGRLAESVGLVDSLHELVEKFLSVRTKKKKKKTENFRFKIFALFRWVFFSQKILTFFGKASDKGAVVAEAEKIVASLAGSAAEHGQNYLRTMKAIVKNGVEHVEKEISRLGRMLEGANVSAKKVDDFSVKLNVLNFFKKSKN